jgi:hypothetical protein
MLVAKMGLAIKWIKLTSQDEEGIHVNVANDA